MKNFILFIVLLFVGQSYAQTDPNYAAYFKVKGGACLVPVESWVNYGIDSIGRTCGQFILAEQDAEKILAEAKRRGSDGKYDIHYLDSMLGIVPVQNVELVHFYIPPENLDKLHFRMPDTTYMYKFSDHCGANKLYVPGGKTITGLYEGFVDRIPYSMLGSVPGSKNTNIKYEVIVPSEVNSVTAVAKNSRLPKVDTAKNAAIDCKECTRNCVGWGWILVLLPLFLFLYLISMFKKGLSDFDIHGALSENSTQTVTNVNPKYQDADLKDLLTAAGGSNPANLANLGTLLPATVQVTASDASGVPVKNYRPSSSRLIAFISGILLLAIAFGMSSFYIYYYLRCDTAPNLTSLSGVLIALGIGMAPYAVNKISGAVSTNKDSNN
jgi:hypothetical protein